MIQPNRHSIEAAVRHLMLDQMALKASDVRSIEAFNLIVFTNGAMIECVDYIHDVMQSVYAVYYFHTHLRHMRLTLATSFSFSGMKHLVIEKYDDFSSVMKNFPTIGGNFDPSVLESLKCNRAVAIHAGNAMDEQFPKDLSWCGSIITSPFRLLPIVNGPSVNLHDEKWHYATPEAITAMNSWEAL